MKPWPRVSARGSASNSMMRRIPPTSGWQSRISASIGSTAPPSSSGAMATMRRMRGSRRRLLLDEFDLFDELSAAFPEVGIAFSSA